jgi:hypothetical protein
MAALSIGGEEARRLFRVVPAPIIQLSGARIAVPGGLLHVLELGTVLEYVRIEISASPRSEPRKLAWNKTGAELASYRLSPGGSRIRTLGPSRKPMMNLGASWQKARGLKAPKRGFPGADMRGKKCRQADDHPV